MLHRNLFVLAMALSVSCPAGFAALNEKMLEQEIKKILSSTKGSLGIATYDVKTGQSWFHNGDKPFKMQSVAKLPIAIAVLKQVDQGKLKLDTAVPLKHADVIEIRESPMHDSMPLSTKSITVNALLQKTICNSNNGAADVLTRLVGGPNGVNEVFKDNKLDGIRVDRYERELIKSGADKALFDTSTPKAICELLVKLDQGKLLSASSTKTLMDMLSNTITGEYRLRAGAPTGAIVAHKTGTGPSKKGVCVSTNDVGIITKPDGEKVVVAVFLTNAPGTDRQRDAVIAKVSKAACQAVQ